MRSSWIKPRLGKENVTQMNFARNGYITEEMDFVAKKRDSTSFFINGGSGKRKINYSS